MLTVLGSDKQRLWKYCRSVQLKVIRRIIIAVLVIWDSTVSILVFCDWVVFKPC